VPAGVIDGAAYPAALDPVISPEIELDAPVQGGAAGPQDRPAVAAGSDQHLVVWTDSRIGPPPRIYGARVAADGTVLDPFGIPLLEGASAASCPSPPRAPSGWDPPRR